MKKENFIFILIAIGILGFSNIPYFLGKTSETDSLIFRGTYVDTADYAVHISMMKAGYLGEWFYQMRFTTEEHTPAFIRLFYIFLGHISRAINLKVETVFQIARWVFGFTSLLSLKLLFEKIFSDSVLSYFAFFITVLGGGIGWLQIILGTSLEPISPIDLWLIDAYFLFSISLFPSFSFTLSTMALSLYLFFRFLETQETRVIIFISILAITTQLFNPIAFAVVDFTMVGAVLFTWWRNRKVESKNIYALAVLAIIQIPLLLYNLLILARDPVWSQFTFQNETLSPPPNFYFWGFLPFWIFAIIGAVKAIQERNPNMGAMTIWIISAFLLAYSPVLIQRRFLLGITIPLGSLTIYGLKKLFYETFTNFQFIKKRQNLFIVTYIAIASVSSLFLILSSSLHVMTQPAKLFYTRDIERAAEWLNENALPNDFVLASQETSQILAQSTSLKMYFGHEMETLYFDEKESMMKSYYRKAVVDDWLLQTSINWVVYGFYEKEIAESFQASRHLILVYENDKIKLYKVSK